MSGLQREDGEAEELIKEDVKSLLRQVDLLYSYGLRRIVLMTAAREWTLAPTQ